MFLLGVRAGEFELPHSRSAIAKADSTSIGELMDATQHIGYVCGRQLGPF